MTVEVIGKVDLGKVQAGLHPEEVEMINSFRDEGGFVLVTDTPVGGEVGAFLLVNNQPVMKLVVDKKGRLSQGAVTHEMSHYDQWRRGDLTFHGDGTVVWKGEVQDTNLNNPVEYWKSEWEQEAFQAQAKWLVKTGEVKSVNQFMSVTKATVYGTHWSAQAVLWVILITGVWWSGTVIQDSTSLFGQIVGFVAMTLFAGCSGLVMSVALRLWKKQRGRWLL